MIRDFGKNNDLVSAKDVANMLNDPSRKPVREAWASQRTAIVLSPINHEYEPVSKVDDIKKFSCFVPWVNNRTAMKKLPCARPCCMSVEPAKMMACQNRAVTGFF